MITTPLQETLDDIHDALQLTRKSLLRSIEFQLFFDIAYIYFLIFIGRILLRFSVDFFDKTLAYLRVGHAVEHIPFLSFIDLHAIFVLLGLFVLLALFYLIETNAVIIITSSYYRNKPISSIRAFLRACIKTPYLLLVRIVELRMHFYILGMLFLLWRALLHLFPSTYNYLQWGGTGLIVYTALLICAILLYYSMSAYVVCLEEKESPYDFDDHITMHARKKRTRSTIMFYILYIMITLIWLIFFSLCTKLLIIFSHSHPHIISDILTLFISGTIMSIFVFLSITKTLRVSILTIIYHDERDAQKMITPIAIPVRIHRPRRMITALVIFTVLMIGMSIISFSTYTKTTLLVSHTEEFLTHQTRPSVHNIPHTSDALADRFFSKDHTTIDIIENTLFSYIALLIK